MTVAKRTLGGTSHTQGQGWGSRHTLAIEADGIPTSVPSTTLIGRHARASVERIVIESAKHHGMASVARHVNSLKRFQNNSGIGAIGAGGFSSDARKYTGKIKSSEPIPSQFASHSTDNNNHASNRAVVPHRLALTKPAQDFLAQATELGWQAALTPLLEPIYGISNPVLIEENTILLIGHEHLVPDWLAELAESIDRKVKNRPICSTSYADAILRWSEFEKHGADAASRKGLLNALKRGQTISVGPDYIKSGTMTVRESQVRELRKEDIAPLISHRLITTLEHNIFESLASDDNGILSDFLEELPKKYRLQFLAALGGDYAYSESTGLTKSGESLELKTDDYLLILKACVFILAEPADSRQIESLTQVMLSFAYKYLHATMPAFREKVEVIEGQLEKINGIKNVKEDGAKNLLSDLYKTTQEFYTQVFLDANLTEIIQSLVAVFLKKAPNNEAVITSLAKVGIVLPTGIDLDQAIAELGTQLEAELGQISATPENTSQINGLKRKLRALADADQTSVHDFAKIRSWQELQAYGAKALGGVTQYGFNKFLKLQWAGFVSANQDFVTLLRTFGMYFVEQELSSTMTLHIVNVRGILAAVAIDTGSDCGQGKSTDRTLSDDYGVGLITNADHSVPYGYWGAFLVQSGAENLVMVDAMNPSTQLNLSGKSFLAEMRAYFVGTLKQTSYSAVLVSDNGNLVSNRESISRAIEKMPLDEVGTHYSGLSTQLSHEAQTFADLILELTLEQREKLSADLRAQVKFDTHGIQAIDRIIKQSLDFIDVIEAYDVRGKSVNEVIASEAIVESMGAFIEALSNFKNIYENANLTYDEFLEEMNSFEQNCADEAGINQLEDAITNSAIQLYSGDNVREGTMKFIPELRKFIETIKVERSEYFSPRNFTRNRAFIQAADWVSSPVTAPIRSYGGVEKETGIPTEAESLDVYNYLSGQLRRPRERMTQQTSIKNSKIFLRQNQPMVTK